jgi:small nuclear ribonucleoprotein (snRNP)-like protein
MANLFSFVSPFKQRNQLLKLLMSDTTIYAQVAGQNLPTTSDSVPQQESKPTKISSDPKPIPQSQLQHMVNASLISFLDRQVCVYTFDETMFVGELSAFDQTNAVTLTNCTQRWLLNNMYAEREVGTMYITGQHVCMVGTRDDTYLNDCTELPLDSLLDIIQSHRSAQSRSE